MQTNKIGVSTLVFDLFGAAVLKCDPERAMVNRQGRRRATRTPTLDGGASVYDTGYTPADRDILVTTNLAHLEWLKRICQVYSRVLVTTDEGAFLAVPHRYWANNNRANAEFLLIEELEET